MNNTLNQYLKVRQLRGMQKIKLQVWVNNEDVELFSHLEDIISGERAQEARRLMRLGLKTDKNKGILQDSQENDKTE